MFPKDRFSSTVLAQLGRLSSSGLVAAVEHDGQERNAIMRADPVAAARDTEKEEVVGGDISDERESVATG